MVEGAAVMKEIDAQNLVLYGSKIITKDPYKALTMIKIGIQIDKLRGDYLFNLGIALHQNKKIDAAVRAYKMCMEADSSLTKEARRNMAQDLLLAGNYGEGLREYEERIVSMNKSFDIFKSIYGEMWEGLNDKRKFKKIIIVAEQGFGDTIQFCRFIEQIDWGGLEVEFFCQEALAPLLKESSSIKKVITSIASKKGEGNLTGWIPLMSLPYKSKFRIEDEKQLIQNYIRPEKKRVDIWKRKLKKKEGKKLIAIHWQGNPKFEKKIYSMGRSWTPQTLNRLDVLKNAEYISIQKGEAMKDRKLINKLKFVEAQEEFDQSMDFRDTAAVLKNCDYLISSDSGVVHLAGAIGLPTCLALNWVPEWRWGLHAKNTFWYKSVKLYRQDESKNWNNVVDKIIADISSS